MTKITITIETENVAVLSAVANAVKNTPPEGFVSENGPLPTEIQVHAPEEKAVEAVEAVVATPEAVVEVAEPTIPQEAVTTPVEAPKPDEGVKAIGQELRQALLGVSKLEGKTIQCAKEIAAKAAGIDVSEIGKDFPSHPKAKSAIDALRGVIANG